MLTSVEIQNFRCFRHVKVPMRPLTILIGANDTGKSCFLEALAYFRGGSLAPIGDLTLLKVHDRWRSQQELEVRAIGQLDNATVQWWCPPGNSYVVWDSPEAIGPISLFRLSAHGIPAQSEGHPDLSGPPPIGFNGSMIPSLLDDFLRRDRSRFFEFVRSMQDLVPGLQDIDIRTPTPPTRRVDFLVERGLSLPGDATSTGVRLMLFFVALAYHPTPPKLILLEEPENGVHPRRLADIVRLLREITQGKHGNHAAQIVLTTHSPYLLDFVDLEQDQVLVFRREDDGSRTAEPADRERLKNYLDEFMLGEVWFNEGEAGLVGRR